MEWNYKYDYFNLYFYIEQFPKIIDSYQGYLYDSLMETVKFLE